MHAFLLALALVAAPPPAPAAAPADALVGFEPASGKTFSGDFDEAPADEALRKILDAAGLSVVMPHGEYAEVSGHFKDAAVEDALRAICIEAGLSATRHGTVVTVVRAVATEAKAEPKQVSVNIPGLVQVSTDADDGADEDRASSAHPARGPDRVVTGDVTVGPGESARDVVALRGNVTLSPGSSARDVTALSGSIEVGEGAQVEGDVAAIGGNVHVAPGAKVKGDAAAIGGKVVVDPGASVHGDRANLNLGLHALPLALPITHESHGSPFLRVGLMAAEFAVCFALGLVFLLGWPRGTERVAHALSAAPARSTVIGMVGLFALPVLGILLAMTGVGLVLWPVEALLFALGSMLGFSALAVLIGRKLKIRARLTPVGQLALGTLLITLAMNIPKLGPVVVLLAWIPIFGAALSTRFGSQDAGPHPTFPIGEALDAEPR